MKTLLLATAVGAGLLFAAGALETQTQARADAGSVRAFPAPVGVDRA